MYEERKEEKEEGINRLKKRDSDRDKLKILVLSHCCEHFCVLKSPY
jgi:hypothetical protein